VATGILAGRGAAYRSLGLTCLRLSRLDEARRFADRALESSPARSAFAADALHLVGDIATHPDRSDADSGEAHYRQALALAEPRGMRPRTALSRLGLGKLDWRTGKREEAREHRTVTLPSPPLFWSTWGRRVVGKTRAPMIGKTSGGSAKCTAASSATQS
jgi:hypothetical protein